MLRSLAVRLTALVLALGAVAAAWPGGQGEAARPARQGVVEYLEGEVTLDGQPAQAGQEVREGAAIRTGEASYCEVVFGGKNIFRIEARTEAVLRLGGSVPAVELRAGGFAAVLSKLNALGRDGFTVQTPVATAGVRGTVFYVQVEGSGRTYICTCNGTLRIRTPAGKDPRRVATRQHKAYFFAPQGERLAAGQAPLLYHSSESMDAMARKIGVRIPWGGGY